MKIEVFNHASIKLTENMVIYFDPYLLEEAKHDADIIFITHDHYDHFEEISIEKAINENTTLVIPTSLKEKASSITNNLFIVEPNKTYTLNEITFETVPAYNNESSYHPKTKDYVGYNVMIDNTKYYVMGDTERTPAADGIKTDICFVPIGGTYTMDVAEAAAYINHIKPKVAIPIHYGSLVGSVSLGNDFKNKIDKEISVEIHIK